MGGRLALILALITGVSLVASVALLPLVIPAGALARDTVKKLGNVPPLQDALPTPPQTSVVYAADGRTVLARLVLDEDRKVVPLKDIPHKVRNAVVAIEDDRFFEHGGIDMRGILRAAVADLRKGTIAQGGSTLTQQYIKKVVTGDSRTLDRKLREAMYAVELERRWSKSQILEAYLNQAYFGDGVYGIATAAQHYFGGKSLRRLTLAEAAALAATIQAPNRLKPTRAKDNKPRRMAVLDRMQERGFASAASVARAKKEKLKVKLFTASTRQPYFVEYIKQQLLHDPAYDKVLGKEDTEKRKRMVFQGGLKIYTTLEPKRQAQARAAVANQLWSRFGRNGNPTGAVASVDPNTGRILALYGGRENFKRSQVDLATARGGSGFQPGSSFKVFYLVAALEKGISAGKVYNSPARITIPDRRCYTGYNTPWSPGNAGDGEAGVFNMYQATAHSVNTYFAQLAMDTGIERAIEAARRMGISVPPRGSKDYNDHWNVCSSVLGVVPVSVLDMASAYGVLANNGVRCPAFSIARIDAPGKELFERKPDCRRVIQPKIASTVTAMLRGVVTGGTGGAAALPGRPVAGKTGTAQEYQSAFFNGYTPQLATSVWVGFTPKPVPMRTQNGGRPVYGGTFPAMIFHDYMTAALAGAPVEGFPAAPPPPAPPKVGVPSVVGLSQGDAEARLRAAGFAVIVHHVASAQPKGRVVRQAPAPGTRLAQGRNVVIAVSAGVKGGDAIVPGVVGLQVNVARALLSASGLSSGLSYSGNGRPGRVSAQSPSAGARLPRGSYVTLVVRRS
ncbi:MAG TPA: transglycosylase domain-containing protein [Actinomycetota bacterium]|nr:transglycosylase domain-containing protein [Actinomycetota bacterium]